MWDIGMPRWWLVAPLVLFPLAAWKVIECLAWVIHHVSIR